LAVEKGGVGMCY